MTKPPKYSGPERRIESSHHSTVRGLAIRVLREDIPLESAQYRAEDTEELIEEVRQKFLEMSQTLEVPVVQPNAEPGNSTKGKKGGRQ